MAFFDRLFKPSWERAATRARAALATGDLAAAVSLFDDALEGAPEAEREALANARRDASRGLFDANMLEGRTRREAGQLDRAGEHFELARTYAPDEASRELAAEAHREAVIARRAQEETAAPAPSRSHDAAVIDDDQTYAILIGAYPDAMADAYEDRDAAFRSAFVVAHRGELEGPLAHFEALVASSPDDAASWVEVGRCRAAATDMKGALAALLEAERAAPSWNHVRLLAAEVCWASGELETAEEVLQRAVDHDDSDIAVYVAICRTAIFTGEPSYGLDAAEAGLEIEPGNRPLAVLKARLDELAGNVDAALAGYERRIAETWRYDAQAGRLHLDTDCAFQAAHLYKRTGRELKRAAELFRGLLSVCAPEERWMHELGLADVLLRSGGREEAEGLLSELEGAVPDAHPLARCRVAALRGDDAALTARLAALTDEQREAWERAEAERAS